MALYPMSWQEAEDNSSLPSEATGLGLSVDADSGFEIIAIESAPTATAGGRTDDSEACLAISGANQPALIAKPTHIVTA